MLNERIVSSFIYVSFERRSLQFARYFGCLPAIHQYYDSENITESKLAFRRATSEPWAHVQDDSICMQVLYDMDRYDIQPNPKT